MTSLSSSDHQYQQHQQQSFQRHKRRSRRALPFKVPAMPLPPPTKDLLLHNNNTNSDSLSTSTSPSTLLTDDSDDELGTSSLGLSLTTNSYRPENSVSVLDIPQEDLIDICTTTTADIVVHDLDEDHSSSIPIIEDFGYDNGDHHVDLAYILGDSINGVQQEQHVQEQEETPTNNDEQEQQEPKKEVVVVVSTHIIEDRLETFSNNMKYIAKSALLQAGGATAAFAMMNNDYYYDSDQDELLVVEEEYEDFVGQHPILDYHRHLNQPVPVGQPQQPQQPQPSQQPPKQTFVRTEQRQQEASGSTITGFFQARASRFSRNCVTLGNIMTGK